MSELEQRINLINDSEPFTAMWDGKEYILTDEPLEVEKGIAEHWQQRHPEAILRIESIAAEEVERRDPTNPLEANDRGEAFAGIKRTRKKSNEE